MIKGTLTLHPADIGDLMGEEKAVRKRTGSLPPLRGARVNLEWVLSDALWSQTIGKSLGHLRGKVVISENQSTSLAILYKFFTFDDVFRIVHYSKTCLFTGTCSTFERIQVTFT